MGEEKKMLTRAEFEAEIIKKAWKDPEYKKRLLESPKEVLEEELGKLIREGIRLPEKMEVHVHEETPYSIHLIIPANPIEYGAHIEGEEVPEEASVGTVGIVVILLGMAIVNGVVTANAIEIANANAAINANAAVNVNIAD